MHTWVPLRQTSPALQSSTSVMGHTSPHWCYSYLSDLRHPPPPTSTSKLQVFLKIRSHICCDSYVFLNHVRLCYHIYWVLVFVFGFLLCHWQSAWVPCPKPVYLTSPVIFNCTILHSTVIFRSTYVMLQQNWLCWEWGISPGALVLLHSLQRVFWGGVLPGVMRVLCAAQGYPEEVGSGAEIQHRSACQVRGTVYPEAAPTLNHTPKRRQRVLIALGIGMS